MMKMLLFVYAVFRWMVDIMELWGRRDELGNEGIEALVGWKELKSSDELKRVCFVIVSRIWIFFRCGKGREAKRGGKKRETTLCGKVWMWIAAYWLTVFVVVVIVAFSGDDVVFVDGAVVGVVLKESNSYFFLHPFSSFLVTILGHFSFFLFSLALSSLFQPPFNSSLSSFLFLPYFLFCFFFCPFSLNESKPNRNRFMKPAYVDM